MGTAHDYFTTNLPAKLRLLQLLRHFRATLAANLIITDSQLVRLGVVLRDYIKHPWYSSILLFVLLFGCSNLRSISLLIVCFVELFAELSAGFVPFISLGCIDGFLLDVADDDALDFGPRLPVFRHQPRALVPQLATHIRLRVAPVKLSRVRRRVHHIVLLWAAKCRI